MSKTQSFRIALIGCVSRTWLPAFEMAAALRAMGHDCLHVHMSDESGSISRLLDHGPAVAITLQGLRAFRTWTPEDVRRLKSTGALTLLWSFDVVHSAWFLDLARAHDVVLHSLKGMVPRLKSEGIPHVRWMPQAYGEDIFRLNGLTPGEKDRFRSEVAFVGKATVPGRAKLLSRVLNEGFDLKWWGPRVPLTFRTLRFRLGQRPLLAAYGGQPVYGTDFAKVASAANVFLGLDRTPQLEGSWSNRLFWALGCGAAYLCRHVPGVEELFEPGRHLETFRSEDECVEKIRMLLNKPRIRMRLSVQGKQEILARHTYHHRFLQIQRLTKELAGIAWQ